MNNKMANKLWILIAYNNDDNHDAETIGIFNTRESAVEKTLSLLKKDFESSGDLEEAIEDDDRFEDFDSENLKWADVKNIFKSELKKGECQNCFSYQNYKISSHKVTTD
jgi:hypothetical protein